MIIFYSPYVMEDAICNMYLNRFEIMTLHNGEAGKLGKLLCTMRLSDLCGGS